MSRGAQQEQAARTRGVAILDRLVVEGRIPPERYDEVMIHAQRTQSTAEEAMIQLGLISEAELLKYIANLYHTRFVGSERLAKAGVDPQLIRKIPRKLAKRLTAFPILFDKASRTLSVVAADVTDDDVRQQMLFATEARDIKIYVAREAAIRAAIAKHYDQDNRPFEMLLSGASSREVRTSRESDPVPGWGQVFEEKDGLLVHREPAKPANVEPANDHAPNVAAPESPLETQPGNATMIEALSAAAEGGDLKVEPEVYLETLNVLVTLIEQLNRDRGGHSTRVARLCEKLGDRIRLTKPQVQGILIAAYLHDVGVSNESHVTPLDVASDETKRELARRAYTAPIRFLEAVALPTTAVDALRHRHEWFDGRGFPERLSGKNIPLGARVLAVAESYVDLTQSQQNAAGRRLAAEDACDFLDLHKGTTFDPAVVDWLRHIVLDDGMQTQLLASRNRVLIVDPDPEETSVLEVRFAERGYEVTIEREPTAALRRLEAENFDIVVSEVQLTNGDGFELLTRIRDNGHKVPMMFLTAKRDQLSVNRGLELGAADYVVKPASAAVVAAKAGRIIEEARSQKPGGRGVSGSLQEMALPDVIQILANGRKSGRLKVRSGRLEGEMMFQAGSIHDAVFGDLTGAEAVYGILRLTDGDFALDPNMDPIEDRIGIPAQHLLLEAMRRMDEGAR
ncbi:MAG: response regulator [Myxococcales bacterium]|nr:response regulator [Myxococcales bacterium]MDH3483920.1 response regulator [Myxococcales bacterium]